MKPAYKNLGKVCLTPEGEFDRNKEYERISMVTDPVTGISYISKKDVPKGVSINNQEYWQKVGSGGFRDNNIIVLSDIDANGNLITYTLQEAIATIHSEDRRPGLILGFYGLNTQEVDYIGTRLHAGIRAIQKKKRTLILSIDNRAIEIAKDINLNSCERGNNKEIKEFILNNYKTDIKIKKQEIEEWKSQFYEKI